MPASILTTKLFVPPPRQNLVPRPRLIQRLDEGLRLGHRLTLISAPAGFGKTTLLSKWVGSFHDGAAKENRIGNGTAWLSLDEDDNEPNRFLAYLIAALQTTKPNIGQEVSSALQSPRPPPARAVLTPLINEIASIPGRVVLILDDYQLIESEPVHEALSFLLQHLPPQMHVVVVTREDPHLPLSGLRARGQLTELRATDLRFTFSEAAEFLNQMMGLDLSAENIAVLERRTEGWIAGLQLAALSLRGHKDTTNLIKSFTGSHRHVTDYLIEEVLEQQAADVQAFLLRTAILDRLSGPLCDALTGQENGQATLEMLDRANLFIVPLDQERRWYRYHHLFSDLLRQRLSRLQPDWKQNLHHQASEWYERNGFAAEAIEHALRGQDFARGACLIDEHLDALWQRGEHVRMQHWLERIPVEWVLAKPQLGILRAFYLFASGQLEEGENLLRGAEEALEFDREGAIAESEPKQIRMSDSERANLRGRAAVIRALISSDHGNVPGIIQYASKALDLLPQDDLTWRSLAAIALGDAHSYRGDMAASYQARSEALRACEAAGDTYYIIVASLKLASTLRAQGRLQQTLQICQQQMTPAEASGLSQTATVGCLLAISGEVLAELNDLDGALQQAKRGVELASSGLNLALWGHSSLCLARVLFSTGDLAGAQEFLDQMGHAAPVRDLPSWLRNQVATWQVRIGLAQGELDAASQWAEKRGLTTDRESVPLQAMDFYLLFDYITMARVLIATSRLDEAAGLLERLLEPAEAGERTTSLIEILLLQALASQAAGDTIRPMTALERALALAEPEGFVRIFVDEGPPMGRLLHEALSRGIAPDYVRRLLAAFPSTEPEQDAPPVAKPAAVELVEPLSERELEILQLIAAGLTNPEIAARLYLSLNTVKAHTRNIYGKLSVHSRTQAVSRSRAVGILPRT